MLSIAHSAKRVSISVVTFVASTIFTAILCPVLAKASNIEPLNDCANGVSLRPPNATTAETSSCQQAGNYFSSTEALQSIHVIDVASDFLNPVQLDVNAAGLSAGVLLSGVGVTESSEAVSDVNQNDSPDRVPEPPSLTLMCIGLVAGLGIYLRTTTSRNTQSEPAL